MQNNDNIYEFARKLGVSHNNLVNKGKNINFKKSIEEYMKNIEKAYNILYEYNELDIPINIPGQWLLDNMYIIEKEYISIKNDLDNIEYNKLPKIDNDLRIRILAEKLVETSEGNINIDNIRSFLYGYSKSKYIMLQELWIFPIMIKLELIKKICMLCKQIVYTHQQKYKVENIIEKYITKKEESQRKYNLKFKGNHNLQINMPFIEYMAYKLRQLDDDSAEYIDIFDEEVLKLGITVDEVVSREHFNVMNREVLISNSILSLKNINNIDFSKEFENISEIDVILSKEKANIYSKMDYDTLDMYRKKICEISKKTSISEKYICNKIIQLCSNSEGKKSHSGYYIIDKGIEDLYNCLQLEKTKINNKEKNKSFGIYISTIFFITIFVTIAFSYMIAYKNTRINVYASYLLSMTILIIPISQLVISFIDKMLLKSIKPSILPSMNFEDKIPEDEKTIVIIPTILSSTKRVEELIRSLEEYYLINKQDNIFFALLGDCSEINDEHTQLDDEIIKTGLEKINNLNKKYNFEIPKFYFLYRNRRYNEKQEKYLGWERKRGLITQFNRFLLYNEKGDFNANTIDREKLGKIKYVLTIDADTQVNINSISKLIGIMTHPLNKPILNKEKTCVINGYGILQPRIINSIECANKNIFSKLYAGYGGLDIYTNAVSDIYQDMWQEGIFTGKGIYDLEIFSTVLDNQIPENTVLSHDLLEGSFLRCGLVTNVQFIDNYPSRYNNYIVRNNRWLRGDIQISRWIKENNPLNSVSRWKIFDNIRRGLIDISLFLYIILGLSILNIRWGCVLVFTLLIYIFPSILDSIFNIKNILKHNNKNYVRIIGNLEGNIYKAILEIIFLPYKAINSIEMFVKTIYRMNFSKKFLLEWMTAEEAEKTLGKDLKTYLDNMYICMLSAGTVISITLLYSITKANMYFSIILAFLWAISPVIAWYISKEKKEKNDINSSDKDFLIKIAFDTWKYFDKYINFENNYLIPDNYQENRKNKIVERTSSTNIGLSFIAIMTAYDLGFINKEKAYSLIKNILNTIDKLEKYRGNLYNWYNIKTLKPLNDNISSVDNGNYIAYLYVLKSFCKENFNDNELLNIIEKNIKELDFSLLYDENKKLFSIEYNVRTGELSKSYYDLLASESRILSFVAIAKGDVPYKHWYSLSRALVEKYKYKGLLSWSGTSFEYFMPLGLMKSYKYSLLDETYDFVVMNQMKYVSKKNIPWGISESAFNLYDMDDNYQYKAFGVPAIALKRGLKDDLVISPYASIIALPKYPKLVIENMKKLLDYDSYGIYGYYDSIDYTKERIENNRYVPVKTFMAHHQGLILMSINNALNNNIFQKRFSNNEEINAIDILLQEKVNKVNILKNKKENTDIYKEKEIKNEANYIYEKQIKYSDKDGKKHNNVLSNKNYSLSCDNIGNGYGKYNSTYITRYNKKNSRNGIQIFIKDKEENKIYDVIKNSDLIYTSYSNIYDKNIDNINIELKINTLAEYPGETRTLKITNKSDKNRYLDIYFYMEPILTDIKHDISHRVYSNMFLQYDKVENGLIITRRKKEEKDEDIFLSTNVICDTENVGKIEYEIDRYKFLGRNKGILNSNAIYKDIPFTNKVLPTIEPIIAYKLSVIIPKEEIVNIAYIQAVSNNKEEAKNILNEFSSFDRIKRNMQLCNNKAIIESKFYKYKPENVEIYQKVISKIVNNLDYITVYNTNENMKQDNLWKYGISGDIPIILAIINRKIDVILINQIITMYKYIKSKLIEFNLVILINCDKQYYSEIYNAIITKINMEYISYDINNNIYILNKNEIDLDTLNLLKKICVINFDSNNGLLSNQNKLLEYDDNLFEEEDKPNTIVDEKEKQQIFNSNDLLLYNDIGGFNKNNTNEYKIILKDNFSTPIQWSNVIANKNFGTIVNENGGGYTWFNNSSQNKLTLWKNDPVKDMPSEYINVIEDNNIYSITSSPNRIKNLTYTITHGFGYSIYENTFNELYIKQKVFVSLNDNVKIVKIDIKNESNKTRKIKLEYIMNILLGNDISKKIYNVYNNKNYAIVQEIYNINSTNNYMYFTGFIQGVDKNVDNVDIKIIEDKCLKAEILQQIELNIEEEKTIYFLIGCENEKEKIQEKIEKYKNIEKLEKEENDINDYWNNIANIIKVKTPEKSMDILLNGWLIYQTISSRLNARSGYYQSSGAYGFRDQLQDVLSIMIINPEMARRQIIYHAKHQYIDGDVMHWWHDDTKAGLRSRYSDDMLWLAYVIFEYIKITGDKEILEENIEYVDSEELKEDEICRYEIPQINKEKATLYDHIKRAIDLSIKYDNENNIPEIGSGDWSDGLNNLYGQSVWLGFFLYDILNKFLKYQKEENERDIYIKKIKELEEGLEKCWDGKWYKRAFTKEGLPLGSSSNDECKIDSIPQAWSVISDFESEKNKIAMESVDDILVDRENKIIKLFYPAFDKTNINPGYIKAYIPGIRENGGQYTHAAIWNIIAQCILKNGRIAQEYFNILNPIEHSKTNDSCRKYKVEPYVIAADIYNSEGMVGRGGWTWYTGAASWMYKAAIEYILGFKKEGDILKIDPCIDPNWNEFEIWYKYIDANYYIKVENKSNSQYGVKQIWLDNIKLEENTINLVNDKKNHEILVEM